MQMLVRKTSVANWLQGVCGRVVEGNLTYLGDSTGDLAGHEGRTAPRRLVVEQDAVGGEHTVRLAVVDHDPVGVLLGHAVRGARIKGGLLGLRDLAHFAIQLGRGGLVEAGEVGEAARADGVEETQCADAVDLRGVFGHLEGHGDV